MQVRGSGSSGAKCDDVSGSAWSGWVERFRATPGWLPECENHPPPGETVISVAFGDHYRNPIQTAALRERPRSSPPGETQCGNGQPARGTTLRPTRMTAALTRGAGRTRQAAAASNLAVSTHSAITVTATKPEDRRDARNGRAQAARYEIDCVPDRPGYRPRCHHPQPDHLTVATDRGRRLGRRLAARPAQLGDLGPSPNSFSHSTANVMTNPER